MTLHRFFLPKTSFQGNRVIFPQETAHQITHVLRLGSQDTVIALDGEGMEYVVRLEAAGRTVDGRIERRQMNRSEPHTVVTLYLGLLKAAKLELVMQKCTEIGVGRFMPIVTERSVAGEPSPSRQRRFAAIVREAAEQSGRGRLPEVLEAQPLDTALRNACSSGTVILLWEDERSHRLEQALAATAKDHVGLFVGPEGGFTEGEVEQARSTGAQVITLGPRILRAETAAIVGSALLFWNRGEM